jgi:hypothetical protein
VYFRRRKRQDSALGHYLAQVWDQRQCKLAYQHEFDAAEEAARGIAEATAEARRWRRATLNGWAYDPWTGESTLEGEQMGRHGNEKHGHGHGHDHDHDHDHGNGHRNASPVVPVAGSDGRCRLGVLAHTPGREGEEEEEEKEAEEEKEEDANLPGPISPLATSPSENMGLPKWKKLAKEERWRFDPWSGARLPGGVRFMAGPPLKAFPEQRGDTLIDPKSQMSPPKLSSLQPITPASRGPPSSL